MKTSIKWLNKFFNIIAFLSFVISILTLFLKDKPWYVLFVSLTILLLSLLGLVISIRLVEWFKSKSNIIFYKKWSDVPEKYNVENTLKYLIRHSANLEIVGRTCFRWLCGNEKLFESDEEEEKSKFKDTQLKFQGLIRTAIESGCSIHFVLQNPHISLKYFNSADNERLKRHSEAAIKSYETIKSQLHQSCRKRLKLSYFLEDAVENSMVQIKEGEKITRFILDLSINFMPGKRESSLISKPVLVFPYGGLACEEYSKILNSIINQTISADNFKKERDKGLNKIESLIRQFSHHSDLRKDESKVIVKFGAENYLAQNQRIDPMIPPISIQLLVTNRCTTKCKMCDHYNLYSMNEMNKEELRHTIECIEDLGTKSIIISGGEPLSRDDIFDVLKFAKDKQLNIGLLTNGIVNKEGQFITEENVKKLEETCSWVQLSIDSFDPEVYKRIRGEYFLDSAIKSLRNLADTKLPNIEICYTIQKDNVDEIKEIIDKLDKYHIPGRIKIRFKFAHGPCNGRDFLCDDRDKLQEAIFHLSRETDRFNSKYISSMIDEGYFNCEGLTMGAPLKNRMSLYNYCKYVCYALKLTCKINANGDVYPCCFLFDDNSANSNIRKKYFLGSLRSDNTGKVMSPKNHENKLKNIWYREQKLNKLRELILPIDKEACSYCTRHFYQNELLNKAHSIFKEFDKFSIAETFRIKEEQNEIIPIWI